MDLNRIEQIFDEWGSLSTSEREAYLDELCGSDAELRAEYERLLAGGDSLEPTVVGERGNSTAAEYTEGDMIDEFKILAVLGEGGMGVVYLAEQQKPVRRRIALKVIKAGMDSAQVIARFEAERQALAIMNHAGIAQVFDAGTTENGRPYFAMEYVKGVPITTACDEYKLDTTQRLELMIEVCDAVNHAHMKGVIHRDLKPSNILVALGEDDRLHPKIIDFGVAKATAQSLTEKTFFTQVGHFIGTPAYMSPEQADLAAPDIDTRTDVYSLGVVLYEVLTGRPPFDPTELRSCGLERMREIIREEDPPSPSTALSTVVGEDATRIARARQTQIDALSNVLRRELEWIPLKALRKARTERYDSARALGEDIRRYLAGEPLTAGPLSNTYRLKKTLRKHKGPVLATALVMLVLVAGIIGTSIFAFRATLATDRAEAAAQSEARQRELAEAAAQSEAHQRELAEEEALRARRNAYAGQLYAAKAEFASGNFMSVTPRMEAAQEELGIDEPEKMPIEWRHLDVTSDQSRGVWTRPGTAQGGIFSPDGSMIAIWLSRTTGRPSRPNHVIEVRESATGKELMSFTIPLEEGAHSRVWSVAFSPDSSLVAVSSTDGVRVWNLRTQEKVHHFVPEPLQFSYEYALQPEGVCPDIAFGPDGTHLASIGDDYAVRLWDLTTGQEVFAVQSERDYVSKGEFGSIAFSPDGRTIASLSRDDLSFWDVATGEQRRQLNAGYARRFAFSPDGSLLAAAERSTVQLFDVETGEKRGVETVRSSARGSLAFSPDGRRLIVPGPGGVWMYSVAADGSSLIEILGKTRWRDGSVRDAVFTQGGTQVIVAGNVGEYPYRAFALRSFDLTSFIHRRMRRNTGHSGYADPIEKSDFYELTPDGTRLIIATSWGSEWNSVERKGAVEVFDVENGRCLGEFHDQKLDVSLASSPDSSTLLVGTGDGSLQFRDLVTGDQLASVMIQESAIDWIGFSPDGTRFYSANNGDGSIRIFDAPSREEWMSARSSPERVPLSWVRNGPVLEVGRWEQMPDALAPSATEDSGALHANGDSRRRISVDGEESPRRMRVRGGDAPTGEFTSIVFSPDSSKLAVCCTGPGTPLDPGRLPSAVEVWDLETGHLWFEMHSQMHNEKCGVKAAEALAFSPDGTELAVTGSTSTSIWMLDTLELRLCLRSGNGVTYTPDNERIIVFSGDRLESTASVLDRVTGTMLLSKRIGYSGEAWAALSPDGQRLIHVGRDYVLIDDFMDRHMRHAQREAEGARRRELEPLVKSWIETVEGSGEQLSTLLEAERVTRSEEEMATLGRLVFEHTAPGRRELNAAVNRLKFNIGSLSRRWDRLMNSVRDQPSPEPNSQTETVVGAEAPR